MKVALIKDGVVENIVEWDGKSEWSPGDGYTQKIIDEQNAADIGDVYDAKADALSKPIQADPAPVDPQVDVKPWEDRLAKVEADIVDIKKALKL